MVCESTYSTVDNMVLTYRKLLCTYFLLNIVFVLSKLNYHLCNFYYVLSSTAGHYVPALGRAILASNSIYAANFKGIGQLHFSQYILTSNYNI